MFLRCAQPTVLTRSSPKGKWTFSASVGTIWSIFLSHTPRLQCPCQAVAATAGTGLAGLCNLIIFILGPPQEMRPKVEVCQVSNPLEWESSVNGQILQWLWKLPEIIHKYLALSSFPAELYSGNLGKQKLVQIQALLTLAGFFFFCCWWSRKFWIYSLCKHCTLWATSNGFCLQCVWNWPGLSVNKMEALPTWKVVINLTTMMLNCLVWK